MLFEHKQLNLKKKKFQIVKLISKLNKKWKNKITKIIVNLAWSQVRSFCRDDTFINFF